MIFERDRQVGILITTLFIDTTVVGSGHFILWSIKSLIFICVCIIYDSSLAAIVVASGVNGRVDVIAEIEGWRISN